MAILRGIETLAIGKQKTVELVYGGGGTYTDHEGEPVKVADIGCYDCMNGYYVLESDPIDFCPHCGYRAGKVWATYEEARTWAMQMDWAWMRELGRQPIGCRRTEGSWILGFARHPDDLLMGGRFAATRALVVDDRAVAEGDGGVGSNDPGRRRGQGPATFGGGGDGWSGIEPGAGVPSGAAAAQTEWADDGLEID
ncbi:MAG: hypothetical protein RIT45_1563 [Pseudomonadota bacterium]